MKKNVLISIALFATLLIGCSEFLTGPSGDNMGYEDFNAIDKIVRTRYPFLTFKHIDWDSLVAVYRPLVYQAKGDEEYTLLHNMLATLKDGHIELWTDGGFPMITYEWPRMHGGKDYNPLVVRKYFTKELRVAGDGNMEYGILPENVGYIYLASFSDGTWIYDLDNILAYEANTKGLIFDVRNNGGGKGWIADFIVSRFISDSLSYTVHYPDGSIRWISDITPGGSHPYFNPVVVLINGASFSASELLAEMMKHIPSVTAVGDTTGGGGGSVDIFVLPSGKRLKMPTVALVRFDGVNIEWNGIPPDVLVRQTETDIAQGRDKQLEKAIILLK